MADSAWALRPTTQREARRPERKGRVRRLRPSVFAGPGCDEPLPPSTGGSFRYCSTSAGRCQFHLDIRSTGWLRGEPSIDCKI
jgi:hypothetical protein